MQTIEFFSGTGSFSKVMKNIYGFETCTIDYMEDCEPTFTHNMLLPLSSEIQTILNRSSIVWLSFPCETFSMASGNKYWNYDHTPKNQKAIDALNLLEISNQIAKFCIDNDKAFIMENPRARARWFLPEYNRYTVWYCQYNHKYAKPTDIWTNIKNFTPKTCKNNNPNCSHNRAPRGSITGTQGKSLSTKHKVPSQLIIELIECYLQNGINKA